MSRVRLEQQPVGFLRLGVKPAQHQELKFGDLLRNVRGLDGLLRLRNGGVDLGLEGERLRPVLGNIGYRSGGRVGRNLLSKLLGNHAGHRSWELGRLALRWRRRRGRGCCCGLACCGWQTGAHGLGQGRLCRNERRRSAATPHGPTSRLQRRDCGRVTATALVPLEVLIRTLRIRWRLSNDRVAGHRRREVWRASATVPAETCADLNLFGALPTGLGLPNFGRCFVRARLTAVRTEVPALRQLRTATFAVHVP